MAKLSPPRLVAALISSLTLSLAATGCSEAPIDPDAMAEQAALHAREMVHQTGGGVSFAASDDSGLQKMFSGMAHASDGLAGNMAAAIPSAMGGMAATGMMGAMSDTPMARAAAGMPSMLTTEEQFDDTADDLRTFLRQRILTAENLETKTPDEAVYLLRGDPTCRALPRETDAGAMPLLDLDCVEKLGKLSVRVVMRADGDGTRLVVQVGPDRLELVGLVIHSNLLAVDVDLAKAHAASDYIDATLGTGSPMGDTQFAALEGAVRLVLRKEGERKVTFGTAVTKALHIAAKDTAEGGPDVRVAPSDPLLSVSVDGVAQTAQVAFDVGAVDVRTHWEAAGMPETPPNHDLHVAIGSLTGKLTFKEGVDELVATGLGIGPSRVEIREATIVDLGLNPANMRRFDLKVTLDANGEPRFEIAPRFDLAVGLHFGAISTDFDAGNQPPSWALDEIYGIRLDNGGMAADVTSKPATTTFPGGLAVGHGTLTLSSNKVPEPVTVPAGQCLTSVSPVPAGAHPLLGALTAATCE